MEGPHWFVTWYPGCQKIMVKIELSSEEMERIGIRRAGDTASPVFQGALTQRAEWIAENELRRLGIDHTPGRGGRRARWIDEDGSVFVRTAGPNGTFTIGTFEAWYIYPVTVYARTIVPPDNHDECREFNWRAIDGSRTL